MVDKCSVKREISLVLAMAVMRRERKEQRERDRERSVVVCHGMMVDFLLLFLFHAF
jgi:hypothetical protein